MSKARDLLIDVQNEIEHSELSFSDIARMYGVTLEYVDHAWKLLQDHMDYCDSMDGDHESALASAGFGTDEDYGYAEDVF